MKLTYRIPTAFIITFALLTLMPGCKDILEEHPYTVFTAEYIKSPAGLQSSVYAAYAGLRYDFGPIGSLDISNIGTDEWTFGDQGRTGEALQEGSYTTSVNDGSILTPWNRNFWHINLCNAVIDFAPSVTMSESTKTIIVAEAHYLRAQYYLLLVQQFGAVPLDLGGAGDLKFNTIPSTDFNRLPTDQLLVKNYQAMIDDLTFASQNLPDTRPVGAFKLSKAAALHMLAKVYLFRGYSAAKQANDFENAYVTAMELINNKALYGVDLLADFGDIHKEGNDYNKEVIFSIERLPLNNSANESPAPSTDFANKVNIANNMFNCNYAANVPGSYFNTTIAGKPLFPERQLVYGRPLRRYCPTKWLLETAFADRVNDSRFDNSFRTTWLATTNYAAGTTSYNDNVTFYSNLGFVLGDTVMHLTASNQRATDLKALSGAQKKKYFIVGPSEFYSNQNMALNIYPSLKKYDCAKRANFQDASGRPFQVSRFSETYLLAAEAALQAGHVADAVPLINTIRERAVYRPGLSTTVLNARKALMVVTAGQITLDFILDERAREFCGESMRWPDLAVRGKLVERVRAFNIEGAPNIQSFHVLKPIPQSQLDAISDTDKAKYQNPGY